MGMRPLGFEGPPLVRCAFNDQYGCLDDGSWTTCHFWFADGTHKYTVLLSSVYVQRQEAWSPPLPDIHFCEDVHSLRPAVYADNLRRGMVVWVHFTEQLDGTVLWRDGYYMGVVTSLVWEHPPSESE